MYIIVDVCGVDIPSVRRANRQVPGDSGARRGTDSRRSLLRAACTCRWQAETDACVHRWRGSVLSVASRL